MSQVQIRNASQPSHQPIQAEYCENFYSRFLGLMFRSELKPDSGIVLVESKDSRIDTSIHMLFMRFDIAVVWINSALEVVDAQIARKWQPWLTPAAPARFVLETLPSLLHNFEIGDRVEIIHV